MAYMRDKAGRALDQMKILSDVEVQGAIEAFQPDALGRKMTPMSTTVHPTATIKATASAAADFPGSPGTVPWTDPRILFLAGAPQAEINGGCSVQPTGGTNPQSNHFSYWITASKFAIMVNCYAQAPAPLFADITVWVDGMPVGNVDPFLVPTGQWFVVVGGLTAGAHLVTVVLGWAAQLVQLVTPSISTPVSAAPAPPFRVALVGDSYVDSGLGPYYAGAGRELARLTGWAVSPMGQGSTGYTNNGASSGDASKSVYGSAARIAAIKAANPDAVIVEGSVNESETAAAVRAAAAAFYAALDPIPVIVLGVQPIFAATEPAYAAWDVTNSAIISAAQAAPNVIGIIDWRSEDWLTGTGSVSAPKGDGNQDVYIGDPAGLDVVHPNLRGQAYLWGRAVERIKTFLLAERVSSGEPGLHAVSAAGASSVAVLNGHTYEVTATAAATLSLTGLPGCQAAIVWSGESGTVEGIPMLEGDTAVAVKLTAGWQIFPVGAPAQPDTTAPTAGTLTVVAGYTTADLSVAGATDETALHSEPFSFSKDNGTTWSTWQVDETYQFTGLASTTSFTFRHRVRDAAGNVKIGTAVVKSTATPPTWTTWAEDDFTGTDGTIVGRATPTGGRVWSADGTGGASAVIASNKLVIDPTVDGIYEAVVPHMGLNATGDVHMKVTFDYEIPADGKTAVSAAIGTAAPTFSVMAWLKGGAVPRVDSGADSWSAPSVAVVPPLSGTAVYEYTANHDGTLLLTVTVDGTLVCSVAGTKVHSAPSTSNGIGVIVTQGQRYSATPRTFDNFKVEYVA